MKTDKIRTEQILRILDIENCRVRLEAKKLDLEGICKRIKALEEKQEGLEQQKKIKTDALVEVRAELHASDYGVKKKELEELETTIQLLAGNSRQWREIRTGLSQWAEDEDISGYISNPTLQCLEGGVGRRSDFF